MNIFLLVILGSALLAGNSALSGKDSSGLRTHS